MRDFENRDVARIVGVNPRTLIDWSKRGLVIPEVQDAAGTGTRRRYSERNLVELAIAKTLLADGIKRDIVRNIMMDMFRVLFRVQKEETILSLEDRPEQASPQYLSINLNTYATHIMGGGKFRNKHEEEEWLLSFAKRVLAAGRTYVLNIDALKEELRKRMEE